MVSDVAVIYIFKDGMEPMLLLVINACNGVSVAMATPVLNELPAHCENVE